MDESPLLSLPISLLVPLPLLIPVTVGVCLLPVDLLLLVPLLVLRVVLSSPGLAVVVDGED